MRRASAGIASLMLLAGCLGPTGRPITAPVPAWTSVQLLARRDSFVVMWTDTAATAQHARPCAARRADGALERQRGDTAWMRSFSYVEPTRAGDPACTRRGGAIVIAPAASVSVEELVPVSLPVQLGGSALFIAAVAGVSLLLFNAVDGLLGIIGRWF